MGWGTHTQDSIARPHSHTERCCSSPCDQLHTILKLDEAVCIRIVSRPNWTQAKDMKGSKDQQK